MDYSKILKRAWNNVWRYQALWIFGILLAMTTVNGFYFLFDSSDDQDYVMRNSIHFSDDVRIYFPGEGVLIDLTTPGKPVFHIEPMLDELRDNTNWPLVDQVIGNISAILISAAVLLGVFLIMGSIFRYSSEAAMIRMVDETESSGEIVSFGQGLRYGFSRNAWRIFLIDLVIFLPLLVGFILLFVLAISPLMLWLSGNAAAGVVGTMLSVGLLILYGLLVFAVAVALSPLLPLFRRACAVDGLGVGASIRQGFKMINRNFVEVIVVWMIWISTRLLWMLALIPVFILLLPVMLMFILLAAVIFGVSTGLLGGLLSLIMAGTAPWIISIIIFMPLFIVVAFAPLFFLSGLVEVFKSSTWTLAYRDLRVLESSAEKPVSNIDLQAAQA